MPDSTPPDVKLIAFYLPQFHPIPENDEWWGKGFTEWTNVTKASPLFDGHYQPHLPADLGFYDLRVREVMEQQIRLAKQHGIDGFCYHYYWFSGKRLLERPLDAMLADPGLDMPFCLCWANETWTRRWDGAETRVLISQKYEPEDDLEFIRGLDPFLRDPRYISVGGARLLIVYRPQHMPDTARSMGVWREYCREAGIGELHLCAALTHGNAALPEGFDSVLDFPPHNATGLKRINTLPLHAPFGGNITDFADIARYFLEAPRAAGTHYRTVFPSWDNTARTGSRANIIVNATPENYENWLSRSVERAAAELPSGRRLVFINAWNEWAEGCHLEPDRRFGHAYLEATARVRQGISQVEGFAATAALPVRRGTLASDLASVIYSHALMLLGDLGNWLKRYPRVRRAVRRLTGKGR
jgi:lipopolysaccharide biosynthesis protein